MTASEHLQVGYISRAHGLKGELAIRTFDPASSSVLEVRRLLIRPRQGDDRLVVVRSVRATPKEFLVFLDGVQRREESEALVGATVFAFRADLTPPEEGEYFQGDLVGLAARTEDGEELGTVEEIWNTGEVPTIVVRGGPRGELAVPFVEAFVPQVDLEAGTVIIRPLEYLE